MKQFLSTIKIVTLGLILALGVGYVSAAGGWVGPTTSPTGGNIEPPVNVSATNQVKSGAFGVGPSLNLTGANAGILAAQKSVLSFGNVVAAGTSNVGGNIFAGLGSLLGAYNGTHDNGAVSADWFCLSPAGGGCINAWPTGSGTGGSGLPNGTITQTLRHNGTTWIASGSLLNDGTNVLVPTGGLRVGQAGGQIPPAGSILANGLIKTFGNTTATNNGDIGASRFCLPGTNPSGGCISTWPIATGGGTGTALTGNTNETIRFSGPNTPVATSSMTNDGTRVKIGTGMADAWERLSVVNGGLHVSKSGTDLFFLNNLSAGADTVSVVSNVPKLNFWSIDNGGHRSDIYSRNVTASGSLDVTNSGRVGNLAPGGNVCADSTGTLYICPPTPPPATPTGQTCGLYNGQPTAQGCPNGSALVQVSADGQTGTCRYYDPGVTTGSTAVPNNGTPYCYAPQTLQASIAVASFSELGFGCFGDSEVMRAQATGAIGSVTYNWTLTSAPVNSYTGGASINGGTTNQTLDVRIFHYDRSAPTTGYTPTRHTFTATITDSGGRTATASRTVQETRAPLTGSNGGLCPQ